MKKYFSSKRSIFIAIFVLFIFGQLAGMTAIKSFFIQDKIKDLMPQLKDIAMMIGEGDFSVSKKNDFIIKAFDVFGKEMNIFDETKSDHLIPDEGLNEALLRYIPRIVAGNTVADLQYIGKLPSQSIVIGVPIVKDGHLTGVVFLLKPASDYRAAINGFSLVFFITLLVGTLFIGVFLWLYIKETKKLEEMRKSYIANISHELKSPISSIKALTETLSDGMVQNEEGKERYYNIILKESHRLEKLITDMLELSKLQSAKKVFSIEEIDAEGLMKNVFDKYSLLAEDMDISFEMTENTKCLPKLYSNENRILQLLNILIDNAMKFVGENGKVTIDSKCHSKEVIIIVKDNGIGIEENSLSYVFDRFYKEDKAHNTGGSGLGLSIAKEIIQRLDEKIEVDSNYGKGTEIRFTVKRAEKV